MRNRRSHADRLEAALTWLPLNGAWSLRDGEREVARLHWNAEKGCYEDQDGVPRGRKFEDAQAACEKGRK